MSAGESARARATKLRADAERLRGQAELWDLGADGEELVGALLDGADRATTRALHDRLLNPGDSAGNLDHVVVCPAGIFLVDAKNWGGAVTVTGDALWQQVDGPEGPRNKNREVQVVRAMAAKMAKLTRCAVTPVICLAGPDSDGFGEPSLVQGVPVVPAGQLLRWLAEQPAIMRPDEIATQAVDLSVQFPPAIGSGLTLHDLVEPPMAIEHKRHRSRRAHRIYPSPSRTDSSPRGSTSFPVRLVVLLVVGLALFVVGSRVVTTLSQGADALTNASTSPAGHPSSTLSATQARALDDWRIRAGLYRDNARPATLRYAPDSALGRWADRCRTQEQELAPFRSGLLRAPDPQLTAAARRYDAAVHAYLEACRGNRPVALHHADGAMDVAASQVNVRYNRLLGQDPSAPAARRIL